jgi:protocatechuate 3,4-dioxygenase beta subunit
MNRRGDLLRSLGAVGSLALLGCRDILTPEAQTVGGSVDPTAVPATAGATQPPAGVAVPSGSQSPANPAPACVLTPRQTEGPFYFDPKQIRRNITEGRPGTPLQVALQVVEAGTCRPIQDALVDIWHADVIGVYSGYTRQGERGEVDASGETFLRGSQITAANGLVQFESIYPGWYPGRAVHIHFKVRFANQTAVTSQLYFPEEVTDRAYAAALYNQRGRGRTTNATDGLLRGAPEYHNLLAAVAAAGAGYRASLTIGIAP